MGGSLGQKPAKARSRAFRRLAAGGAFILAMLAEVNCIWAPDLYGQMLIERRRQHADLPPGHPEALLPGLAPSPAEAELWSRLGLGWTRTDAH